MKILWRLGKEAIRYKALYIIAILSAFCLTAVNLAAPKVLSAMTGLVARGGTVMPAWIASRPPPPAASPDTDRRKQVRLQPQPDLFLYVQLFSQLSWRHLPQESHFLSGLYLQGTGPL